MQNRFLEMDRHIRLKTKECDKTGRPRRRRGGYGIAEKGASAALSVFAQPFAATDRALVILIENGGIDLGIPELVDKILSAIPGSGLIPDSYKKDMVEFLRKKIKGFTDNLLESAELAVNRFSSAAPGQFAEVAVLRDGSASYNDLKSKLISLSQAGKMIDLFILTHGNNDYIHVRGEINGDKIRAMRKEYGKPLSLRCVYMMNCVGASLNQAWLDAGAKACSGTVKNNYLPEPSMFFFWKAWKEGEKFETAVINAYRKTVNLMNDAAKGFVRAIPLPGTGLLADKIDFSTMDFVRDSAPLVQGSMRDVTVNSDSLTFTQSVSSPFATTVLPVKYLRADSLSRAASVGGGDSPMCSYTFSSPSVIVKERSSYSEQMNPALVAGIEIADAISIGLSAVGLVQAQVSASQGSFSLSYDKAQRLLTSEARAQMPGSQSSKKSYSHRLMFIGMWKPIEPAYAEIIIEWEGNPYGEIGTPVIRRNLSTSTEWSKSSANVTITRVERIPLPKTDPRTWPINYTYEGTYDPYANGYFEFSGEFELNAFGGLKFNRHEVFSRSFIDFTIGGKPENKVKKGDDVIVAVPTIPKEQLDYLKTKLP
jgi:hypothetical protein